MKEIQDSLKVFDDHLTQHLRLFIWSFPIFVVAVYKTSASEMGSVSVIKLSYENVFRLFHIKTETESVSEMPWFNR